MLRAIKLIIRAMAIPGLYIGAILTFFLSIFKEAKWGLFLMIVLIPMPNLWYKIFKFPMGKDILDLLVLAIFLGILFQKKGFAKTKNSLFILCFILLSYFALWNSSLRFSLPYPLNTSNYLLLPWKNYVEMIFLYFLALNVFKSEHQHKIAVVLISCVILFISIRCFRNFSSRATFSYDRRAGGPFAAVGLGSNHFGAFIAHFFTFLLGVFLLDEDKKRKLLYLITILFSIHPLLFSYSRGAYLAAFASVTLIGIITKKKSLFILLGIIIISWKVILPSSVVDRITMTKSEEGVIEESAAARFILWDHALSVFSSSPLWGIGFGGFPFTIPETAALHDTHSFYFRTLCEQGIIGISFLLLLFIKAFKSGWHLLKIGKNNFYKGIALGFLGCVIACMITNLFGDRWSYFVLGGYFWILWGLVDRGILISQAA